MNSFAYNSIPPLTPPPVSHNGGATWQQRSNVFVPAEGFNAGSPQVTWQRVQQRGVTRPCVCFARVLSITALIAARVLVLLLAFTLQTSAAAALFQDTTLLTCLFNSKLYLRFVFCADRSVS